MTLFSDNAQANSEIRNHNIERLRFMGFNEGGLPCRSGELVLVEKSTKWQLVFGIRSNISGGKSTKYFSYSKDYTSKLAAINEFESIKFDLQKK